MTNLEQLEQYSKKLVEASARYTDQKIRLDVVAQRIEKIRGQLDSIISELATYKSNDLA